MGVLETGGGWGAVRVLEEPGGPGKRHDPHAQTKGPRWRSRKRECLQVLPHDCHDPRPLRSQGTSEVNPASSRFRTRCVGSSVLKDPWRREREPPSSHTGSGAPCRPSHVPQTGQFAKAAWMPGLPGPWSVGQCHPSFPGTKVPAAQPSLSASSAASALLHGTRAKWLEGSPTAMRILM